MILILDNHGQYVHRILRSLRYLSCDAEIISNSVTLTNIKKKNPTGIILSGGPYSVYDDEKKLKLNYEILGSMNVPVLGICLGHQLIAKHFGGEVRKGRSGEYAAVEIKISEKNEIFAGLEEKLVVWESHRDEVSKISKELKGLAESDICKYEAIRHKTKPVYGVQFHPEVNHTPKGLDILRNFIKICE